MTGRCKDCRHWGDEHIDKATPFPARFCRRIPQEWDATEWSEDWERVLKPEYAGTLAFACDGSSYAAGLATLPDFGCVMFEE